MENGWGHWLKKDQGEEKFLGGGGGGGWGVGWGSLVGAFSILGGGEVGLGWDGSESDV